ncbi:hypothetical protein L934_09260, partial [Helicobacter pylori PZ5080]
KTFFFKGVSFLNSLFLEGFDAKSFFFKPFSFELSFLKPFFLGFDLFLFANPHCFRFLIFEFYFWGGLMQNPF